MHVSWSGKCSSCGQWDCIVENAEIDTKLSKASKLQQNKVVFHGLEVDKDQIMSNIPRRTKFSEFDRAIGGGVVYGGVYLIGGDPGVGKSTLLGSNQSKIK